MVKTWLVDFDDTLATGPITWGYEQALPEVIKKYELPVDLDLLEQGLLIAQEKANETTDLRPILDELFELLNWPKSLQGPLLQDVQENYHPELFEDARLFLEELHRKGQTVIILSNNPRTPSHAKELGLHDLVDAVVTPHMFPGTKPKPNRSFWDRVIEKVPTIDVANAVVVGDDPWSDLAFAEVCGLCAWLLDRHDRYAGINLAHNAQRVRSLLEIPIP